MITGYFANTEEIVTSRGEHITEPPYLGWLTEHTEGLHCCYHLDHFVACLCKLIELTEPECRKFLERGKLSIPPYVLQYVPGKYLTIKKGQGWGRPFVMYSDVSKYIEARFSGDGDKLIRKAEEAAEIGTQMHDALLSLGLSPKSLVSPVRAFEKEKMESLGLPKLEDIPEQCGEFAYQACKGNWVEAFSKGHFEETWDWDINSAYPHYASMLPGFSVNDWVRDNDVHPKASIGVYRCIVEMEAPFHPVLFKNKDDENYTPTGKWEDCLNLRMIKHIRKYKLGQVRVLEGWALDPTRNGRTGKYPLMETMLWLYKEKEKTNGMRRETIKRIMTGIYGKFLELRQYEDEVFGPWFNPVYGMEIESNTRIEVSRWCLENKVLPLHVAVDGVLVDRELGVESSGTIGEWRLAGKGKALVIGSGQVAVEDRKGIGEFALDYDWLMEHGLEKMEKLSPVTLKKAVDGKCVERLGELETVSRSIDLDSEVKRCYKKKVRDWEELVSSQQESVPWDRSIVESI